MRVVRGRGTDPEDDRAVTASLVVDAAETGEPALRVWAPHRQVAFGRRDAREARFEAAKRAAGERGFVPLERSVGGRAVAYTGETTLAFAHAVPITDERRGIDDRYESATETVLRALRGMGVDAERGEPADSFCPGDHSIRSTTPPGGKLVGVAQRVRQGAALVAGCVLVADRAALQDVLEAVYGELGVDFDPESVGTVADAGGPGDPGAVRTALEDAFVATREKTVEYVDGG
ncbi:biotin/lipoate A/B protein ligase family protein [Halobium salinum]|uniref:Biotin/lipoate A/B protein ligase family protein n=1 Tax=Halobium salinum TaxID=1364940 RepID=A0ABD5PAR0_9EURY|nr:lipoate--protein ligase family protein [Halobium salinum]